MAPEVLEAKNEQILEKFKQLYLKKYGISLSDKDATEKATAFLNLMKILVPLKRKECIVEV